MKPLKTAFVLHARALNFGYPNHVLFSNFDAIIAPGITLVRGGDGRGKSTLLGLMAGELLAQSGQLDINGIALATHSANYKAQIFWAEPRTDAFDQLTALDYFELQRRRYADFDAALLADMTHGLGIREHLHKQLFMLSTGTKRKVFLAAAFASGAAITLLDEPFAALDAASIAYLLSQLESLGSHRAWVLADYVAPSGLVLLQTIDLGE